MLAEFVQSIRNLAVQSEAVQKIDLPRNKVLIVNPSGETITVDNNRKTQNDLIASFNSLCDWSNTFELDDGEVSLVFTVSNTGIGVANNRNEPHDCDTARMPLVNSEAYADLLDWCKSPRSVKPLVRGLRTKLFGTYDDRYLSIFKRLDFARKNDGSKSVSHTSESMGRSVEMAAQSGAGEIPETLVFDLKLFDGLPIDSYELRFAVEVDANSETVSISPIGSCIADAHQSTRIEIIARLKTEFPKALVIESVN